MPYSSLGFLIWLGLCGYFLFTADVSLRSKIIVGVAAVMLLTVHFEVPSWSLYGSIAQMIMSIALLFYFKLNP